MTSPIAIVGRSCVLPGALSPQALWEAIIARRDLTSEASLEELGVGFGGASREEALAFLAREVGNRPWSDRGGIVRGFGEVFDPKGFLLAEEEILGLDPLFQWTLHGAREALRDSGLPAPFAEKNPRARLVLANLGYPSASFSRLAESTWLERQDLGADLAGLLGLEAPSALNRFSSGGPAFLTARALNLGSATALDAACASSLYAIDLACAALADGRADMVLTGAVSCIDPLIYFLGFSGLMAISSSGQSRPFDEMADGLLPCMGAAFVVLKRLEDAMAAQDRILGVVRAVGLANDGRAGGFLFPAKRGQVAAMQRAYERCGLSPQEVSLLEFHATGTPVGDPVEIESCKEVFGGAREIAIGSLKSNLGHSITVAGLAGLLKVLGALEHRILPPNRPVQHPASALQGTPFRLVQEPRPWEAASPRLAGINAFGFGGNDAHLIVQEWTGEPTIQVSVPAPAQAPVAIVAVEAEAGSPFIPALYQGSTSPAPLSQIELPLQEIRFPPKDLAACLPQQLWILELARRAASKTRLDPAKTSVFIGMEVDAETARVPARFRLLDWALAWAKKGVPLDEAWVREAQKAFGPEPDAATGLGTMPNIVANRINNLLDLQGPSFCIEAEEASGLDALEIARRALATNEIDTALVGAVDLCREEVHAQAAKEVLPQGRRDPGDACVLLVLKRLEDARVSGEPILAILEPEGKVLSAKPEPVEEGAPPVERQITLGLAQDALDLTPFFGHAHAASGLLHLAGAVVALNQKMKPAQADAPALPWLSSQKRSAKVHLDALAGQEREILLAEGESPPAFSHPMVLPRVFLFSGKDEKEILDALLHRREGGEGQARLALVAKNEKEFSERTALARRALESGKKVFRLARGVYFRQAPISGELAFVFPGAAAAYAGMGREFLLAFPEVGQRLLEKFPEAEHAALWLDPRAEHLWFDPQMVLFGCTFYCQVHAEWSLRTLGLRPQAVLGVSSGETNAVLAMGAWQDPGQTLRDIVTSGMYSREIAGDYGVVRRAWGIPEGEPVDWQSLRIVAPPEDILAAIEGEPRVFLTMVNARADCIVAGEGPAVARVAQKFGPQKATVLGHDIVAHCPLMKEWEAPWRAIHDRETRPVPGVRFYSNASSTWYEAERSAIADALTHQATGPVDFRRVVEAAYRDGVRFFLEHGPRVSSTHWIDDILGEREHLAVALDRPRGGLEQPADALAQLWASGLDIPFERLPQETWQAGDEADKPKKRMLVFPAHAPEVRFPPLPNPEARPEEAPRQEALVAEQERSEEPKEKMMAMQDMPSAPSLASVAAQFAAPAAQALPVQARESAASAPGALAYPAIERPLPDDGRGEERLLVAQSIAAFHGDVAQAHRKFLAQQARAMDLVLALAAGEREVFEEAAAQVSLISAPPPVVPKPAPRAVTPVAVQETLSRPAPQAPMKPAPEAVMPSQAAPAAGKAAPATEPQPAPKAATATPQPAAKPESPRPVPAAPKAEIKAEAPRPKGKKLEVDVALLVKPRAFEEAFPEPLPGPKFSRKDLEHLSRHEVSGRFGPQFEAQDQYGRQVRMPMPPLLLAEEILGTDAAPLSMAAKTTMWTASRLPENLWCLHHGRLPAFLGLEVGQADLLLVSWLGVDMENQGERMYRLLGCDVIYHGKDLARPGQRILCDIHVDSFIKAGPVRVFFFHGDAWIDKERQVSTVSAQAGFFTEEELGFSGGVLWDAATADAPPPGPLDAPLVPVKNAFTREEVRAFSEGRPWECFGEVLAPARAHSRTPAIPRGPMCLFDEVTHLDPQGGPWGRGYARAVKHLTLDEWFYDGHFYQDPCMPGTLMCEGAFELLSFYLTALGHTLDKDGWRFVPVPGKIYPLRARGQVIPGSKELVYEVFIREISAGGELGIPYLQASVLCTVDGLKSFLCETGAWALYPGFPLDSRTRLLDALPEDKNAYRIEDGDMALDRRALLQLACGKPSLALGPSAVTLDLGGAAARLAGPPYLFLTRVTGFAKEEARLDAQWEVEKNEWFFSEALGSAVPPSLLLEAGAQACLVLSHLLGLPEQAGANPVARLLQAEITPLSIAGRAVGTMDIAAKHLGEGKFEVRLAAGEKEIARASLSWSFLAQEKKPLLAAAPLQDEALLSMLAPFSKIDIQEEGVRAEISLDPGAWWFSCNALQDPHLPLSLFLAASENALKLWAQKRLGKEIFSWEPLGKVSLSKHLDVLPSGEKAILEVEIESSEPSGDGLEIKVKARLVANGATTMEAQGLSARACPGFDASRDADILLEDEAWAEGFSPWGAPMLPLSVLGDWLAQAALARLPGRVVLGMENFETASPVLLDRPRAFRLRAFPLGSYAVQAQVQAWDDKGQSWQTAASAKVLLAEEYHLSPRGMAPLEGSVPVADPYGSARLFHGKAFGAVKELLASGAGADAVLDASPSPQDLGVINPRLLESAMSLVFPKLPGEPFWEALAPGKILLPIGMAQAQFLGPTPCFGEVEARARFLSWEKEGETFLAEVEVLAQKPWERLLAEKGIWARMVVRYRLFSRPGPEDAPFSSWRAWTKEKKPVPDFFLSQRQEGGTTLFKEGGAASVLALPGAVQALYGASLEDTPKRLAQAIAIKEHVGLEAPCHPGLVNFKKKNKEVLAQSLATPLVRYPLRLIEREQALVVENAAAPFLDFAPVVDFWRKRLGMGGWIGEDLFLALARQFSRGGHLEDPVAWGGLRDKGALFFANHQLDIEGILFSLFTAAHLGKATHIMARREVAGIWIGKLFSLLAAHPKVSDPGLLGFVLVERTDPLEILREFQEHVAKVKREKMFMLIHVEGEHARRAGQRVERLSATLVDAAVAESLPIVPLRFSGALPREPVSAPLEYPVNFGKQEVWVGAPIHPEELAPYPSKIRKERVLAALNALGPQPYEAEEPLSPDPVFAARVEEARARLGLDTLQAMSYCLLRALPEPSQETQELLEIVEARGRTRPEHDLVALGAAHALFGLDV